MARSSTGCASCAGCPSRRITAIGATGSLPTYTTLETRESWWHLPDGQTLQGDCEQHPFGGVTYLYENVTEKIRLESQYNELIGVQRETLDNLHEGVALFGTDGRLKLYNPTFARFWGLAEAALDEQPHIREVVAHCRQFLRTSECGTRSNRHHLLDSGRRSLKGRLGPQ